MLKIRTFYCAFDGDADFIEANFNGLSWYELGSNLIDCGPLNGLVFQCEQPVQEFLDRIVYRRALSESYILRDIEHITSKIRQYLESHESEESSQLEAIKIGYSEDMLGGIEFLESSNKDGQCISLIEFYEASSRLLRILINIRRGEFTFRLAEEEDRQVYRKLNVVQPEIESVYELTFD